MSQVKRRCRSQRRGWKATLGPGKEDLQSSCRGICGLTCIMCVPRAQHKEVPGLSYRLLFILWARKSEDFNWCESVKMGGIDIIRFVFCRFPLAIGKRIEAVGDHRWKE